MPPPFVPPLLPPPEPPAPASEEAEEETCVGVEAVVASATAADGAPKLMSVTAAQVPKLALGSLVE